MPAPFGNKNHVKHGLTMSVGTLPPGCSYIRRNLGKLEEQLSKSVIAKYGQISIVHSALIQSAVRHECRAGLILRWIRKGAPTMNDLVRLKYLNDLSTATDARDKCILRLQLDPVQRDAIAALYASDTVLLPVETEPANTHETAAN